MEDMETWKEFYSRAKVATEGGEDLLSCKPLFSNNQRWLFVGCGCHVKVISLGSKEVVHTLIHHSLPITALAQNPRNHMQLVTASLDGQLALWDFTDGALLRVIDFSTPLFNFRFRPGSQEPSLFFLLHKDEASYAVVGVSNHVITERESSTAPGDQLADAQQYISTKKPNSFTFTYDGSSIVSFSGKKLFVYDLENENKYSYRCSHSVTTVDCHPRKPCIATGNSRGEIQLWYDFARSDAKVVVTTFHWHAHSVAEVCFTSDGSYLLSGGEESVLVLWQLDSHKKQFRPRLGAPISKLACCHGDAHFAVSLQSNVVCLLSGLDTEVEHIVGGLRKAYLQDPKQSGLRTGLVWCPRSNSILLNSTPGFLQFYDPFTDAVIKEMDIACLNIVSRLDDKPLELTTIEHVAFSPDGVWLATIESRDDQKTAPELKMKLWEFSPTHQRYILNTCVDPPHGDKVTDLTFQPSWRRHGSEPGQDLVVYMAVTTSLDGQFKSWVLVDGGRREEVGEGRKGKEVGPSWACRSVGYYHNLPCLGAAFSQDGSLLALNFKKYVTLWDPFSCDLLKTLNAPLTYERFVHLTFGSHSSSQYLLASTTTHLLVWNMLTCTMQWCIKASVSHLVSDPFSSVAVAFVTSDSKNSSSNMMIFSPACSSPLAVHEDVCPEEVVGAVFIQGKKMTDQTSERLHHGMMKSKLYFMDRKQVMYSLKWEEDDDGDIDENEQGRQSPAHCVELASQRTFTEIFGDTERSSKPSRERLAVTQQVPKSLPLLNGAPHVLPPMSILCQHYLKALLPSSQTEPVPRLATSSEDEVNSGDASSDDEVGGHQSDQLVPQKRQLSRAVEDAHLPRTSTATDYSWLTNSFKSL